MDACSQCKNRTTKSHMITCEKCAACVHLECLKAGRPSPIEGDIFFQFTCSKCSPSDEEQLKHMKLPWITVVHLALYNLQLEGKSKCGFFKWKEHVCAYIDRHWHNFFDCARKKSVTWHGTVAGTLSNGSPQFFTSGSTLLKQPGWWKLSVCKPPTLQSVLQFKSASTKSKTGKQTYKEPVHSVVEEPRSRPKISPIEAAIQRKAKRDSIDGTKDSKKQKLGSDSSSSHTESQVNLRATTDQQVEVTCDRDPLTDKKQHLYSESVSALLGTVDSDSDIEIDPCSLSPLQTGSQHTEHVENVVTNPLGHHENNPGDSWDQIMANFCAGTVPDVGSTVVIKQEPEDLVPEVVETVIIKPEPWSADCADEVSKNRQFTQNSWQESALIKNESASHPQPEHASYSSIEDFRVTTSTSEIEAHLTTSCDTSQYQSEAETISETDETSSYSTEVSDNVRLQTRKRRRKSVQTEPITAQNKQRYALMSMYEEKQLLKSLLTLESAVHSNKKACRLKRKLQLREIKRERGMPTFDLDAMMNRLVEQKSQLYGLQFTQAQENFTKMKPTLPQSSVNPLDVRILDRFQEDPTSSISVIETDKQTNVHESNTSLAETHQPVRVQSSGVSFLNKLVGTEDDQLQSIHSPYTSRVLKPFIRRDYETVPLKMKLLSEIQAYAYRDDPDWKPPSRPPIDYCYVRPQHIPTVNSYCKEFFWPGIDMSECLQYPDFSCIVMYRKFVIGFAFMVPDVKHNEAYISFIFTHPEWRGAGIAKFMVYHLIQTCMGKDVTLHVSANNPAMLLYQKFGFKPEEFILDFYDKYFPLDSKESRHAFFLRLRR